jgi:hypothetical protein
LCWKKGLWNSFFSQYFSFPTSLNIPSIFLSHSDLHDAKDKHTKPGNISKSNSLSKIKGFA